MHWHPDTQACCRYEVTLGTAGIQQLGWATLKCTFNSEEGVGDTRNSYAFDGKRRHKWNLSAEEYGMFWQPGDVVGVCIDLDSREVLLCATVRVCFLLAGRSAAACGVSNALVPTDRL